MKINKLALMLLGVIFVAAMPVMAAQGGTKDEAKAMAEKAVTLIKENPDKAFAKFQEKDGGFIDRDLYVFVLDKDGIFKAHGAKPVLVGKGGLAMTDVSGFAFVKAFMDVKENGWVDYKWPDPTENNKIKDKSTYIIKVGEYTMGVGYYKN